MEHGVADRLGHRELHVGDRRPYRARELGHRGAIIDVFEIDLSDPGWDRLWATASEIGLPLSFHLKGGMWSKALQTRRIGKWPYAAYASVLPLQLDEPFALMMFSGALERHPGLELVLAEAGIGWVPYFIHRMDHEWEALRDKLRCKEVWVVGANRYRNPDDDVPADFEAQRTPYYQALNLPLEADRFVADVQAEMRQALHILDAGLPTNALVRIGLKRAGRITVTPIATSRSPGPDRARRGWYPPACGPPDGGGATRSRRR